MKQRHRLLSWKFIVTGFGSGYIPFAPGTMGSITALLPAVFIFGMLPWPNIWLLVLILIFSILGITGAEKLKYQWGKDPSRIVIDEMVGMWISLLFTGGGWINIVAAFVVFRFFDIFKPLGIRKAEELPGGIGVMADDVLAGIYTNIVIQVLIIMTKIFA